MTLFVLAIAYIVGVWGGSLLVQAGLIGCDLPEWLWVAPLVLLPVTPLLNVWSVTVDGVLRWPESAGFVRPRRGVAPGLVVAALLCVLMGGLRMASAPRAGCWQLSDLAAWNLPSEAAYDDAAPTVTVVGFVSNFPTTSEGKQEVVVAVSRLRQGTQWHEVTGQARLLVTGRRRYEYGQPVEVTGRLATPPVFEDFSYRDFLAQRGINSHFYDAKVKTLDGPMQGAPWRRWLYAARSRGMTLIERILPEPQAALAEGMLLGVGAAIPDELYDRFNATGTSHVLVISGSNVALIAALLLGLSRRLLGRRWSTLMALLGIAAFTILVGAEASVLRAGLMGGLVVIAVGLGRRSTALISLAVACWVMLLVNPLTLYDVGFQLSAVATLGLILFATSIIEWLSARWSWLQGGALGGEAQGSLNPGALLGGMVVDGGVMTLAASILTLPLVAYHFQRLSLLGLFVNLLILPVQPMILVAGTLGVVGGLLGAPWVAQALLWVSWLGLAWTIFFVNWASLLPGASVQIGAYGLGALVATYVLIALVYAVITHNGKKEKSKFDFSAFHPNRITSSLGLGVLALLAVLLWAAVYTLPDGRLHLYFLDIGQGDGILIQTPSGRQLLIDGGSTPERLMAQLGEVMPWWDRSIDMMLATHPDHDHIGGQESVPQRFHIDYAVDTPAMQQDPDGKAWREAMTKAGIEIAVEHAGGWVDLGDGVALWMLWPPEKPIAGDDASNENSLVTKLVYGDFSVLLTGDAGIPSESTWLAEGLPLDSTILKVGHHGSANSTSTGLVAAVDPQWAIIQVGANNTYGHPTQEALDALAGHTILRNDQNGRIDVATDGKQVWVETER